VLQDNSIIGMKLVSIVVIPLYLKELLVVSNIVITFVMTMNSSNSMVFVSLNVSILTKLESKPTRAIVTLHALHPIISPGISPVLQHAIFLFVKELIPSNIATILVKKTRHSSGTVLALPNAQKIFVILLFSTSLSVNTLVIISNTCIGMVLVVICVIIHGFLMSKEIDTSVPSLVPTPSTSTGTIHALDLVILQLFLSQKPPKIIASLLAQLAPINIGTIIAQILVIIHARLETNMASIIAIILVKTINISTGMLLVTLNAIFLSRFLLILAKTFVFIHVLMVIISTGMVLALMNANSLSEKEKSLINIIAIILANLINSF